ncbi:MAG: malectin domain-containing carbohydrate-binding protein, partial [Verrucomicrobiota bacterium]
ANLIPANGVFNAPDYTRTCNCGYQNQTSLALIHMPDVDVWSFQNMSWDGSPAQRVGINFGAPGDRLSPEGTYWLDHPSKGGPSPNIPVQISGGRYFRKHTSVLEGELPWVCASGVEGAQTLTITASKHAAEAQTYTVRIYAAEENGLEPGQRIFGIDLNGVNVLSDFDIARESGGAGKGIVKTFTGIAIEKDLKVDLKPAEGSPRPPLICGIELIREASE